MNLLVPEIIRVTCLPRAEQVAEEWGATLVVSLLDPDLPKSSYPKISVSAHSVHLLHDQERSDATAHFGSMLRPVVAMISDHLTTPKPRLLIHCHAGVSRSTALAYGAIAMLLGPGRESAAFNELLKITRKPWPNRRIVECLDDLLGREGTLLSPLDQMREKHPRRIDHYRRFNRRRGLVGTVPR